LPNRVFFDYEYYQNDGHPYSHLPWLGHWWWHMKTVVIAQKDDWLPEDGDTGDIDLNLPEEQACH